MHEGQIYGLTYYFLTFIFFLSSLMPHLSCSCLSPRDTPLQDVRFKDSKFGNNPSSNLTPSSHTAVPAKSSLFIALNFIPDAEISARLMSSKPWEFVPGAIQLKSSSCKLAPHFPNISRNENDAHACDKNNLSKTVVSIFMICSKVINRHVRKSSRVSL